MGLCEERVDDIHGNDLKLSSGAVFEFPPCMKFFLMIKDQRKVGVSPRRHNDCAYSHPAGVRRCVSSTRGQATGTDTVPPPLTLVL